MTCEMEEERLVGYLYREMAPGEEEGVKTHLAGCPACQKRLERLSRTAGVLRTWTDEDPNIDLVFVREPIFFRRLRALDWLREKGRRRLVAAAAVGLAAAALILAFATVEMGYREGAFRLTVGLRPGSVSPPPADRLDAPVTRREFAESHQRSLEVIQEMLRTSEDRQQEAFRGALVHLARGLEVRRQIDLDLMGRGLEGVGRSAEYRFRQSDALLQHLVRWTEGMQAPSEFPVRRD